jgi:hypothetical protein
MIERGEAKGLEKEGFADASSQHLHLNGKTGQAQDRQGMGATVPGHAPGLRSSSSFAFAFAFA